MPVQAQEDQQAADQPALLLLTDYPSQLVGIGETATLDLSIEAGQEAQTVDLMVENLPATGRLQRLPTKRLALN